MENLSNDTLEPKPFLFGGIALLPFSAVFLLAAVAFAQGWLNWGINGGPPFLGEVAAFIMYRLIRRYYYNQRYGDVFDPQQQEDNKRTRPGIMATAFVVFLIVAPLGAWYLDANALLQVRLLPLVAGLILTVIGGWHDGNQQHILSKGYMAAGGMMMVYSLAPLVLQVRVDNRYFGLEGVWELVILSAAILVVALAEHRTITKLSTTTNAL